MKRILFVVCLFTSQVNAQNRPIILKTERNMDNTFSIIAVSDSYAHYTVRLKFGKLIGYTCTLDEFSWAYVNRGEAQIAKVRPIKNTPSYSFNYSFRYYMGQALSRVPDTTFGYLLPATVGKRLIAKKTLSLAQLVQKEENALHSVYFAFNLGDTICATRAGIIVAISDTVSIGEKKEQFYSQERDRITIEQKDFTLAHYTILAPIKTLVRLEDKVWPGQPIAVFNKENDKYQLIFSVNYLDSKKFNTSIEVDNKKINYHTTLPVNWILDNQKMGYLDTDDLSHKLTVVHPEVNIGIELSKREKKKLNI